MPSLWVISQGYAQARALLALASMRALVGPPEALVVVKYFLKVGQSVARSL